MNLDPDSKEKLLELADELALNYFDVSFDFQHDDINNINRNALIERVLQDGTLSKTRPSRNIVIIGAGASKSSHGLKTAGEAIKHLNNRFGLDSFGRSSFFKLLPDYLSQYSSQKHLISREQVEFFLRSFHKRYVLERDKLMALQEIPDPKKVDFESHLSLLAHFFSLHDIRKELQKLYDHKYAPSEGNTILAHLLKHRFVDAIINFNFDELLDEIIQEQLKGGDYHEIISDGHCQEMSSIVINDRLKVPVYIKPHGTVSHKSTMKFTKDDYFGIPLDLQKQLEDLIGGSLGIETNGHKVGENSEHDLKVKRVNLICIGFAMRSVEFNNIIKAQAAGLDELKIYFFDTDATLNSQPHVANLVKDHDHRMMIHLPSDGDGFGYAFGELWKAIENKFSIDYKPRGTWENNIVTRIFHSRQKSERRLQSDINYFLFRVLIEVVIAMCKGKGKVYLSALVKGSSGKYYELFVNEIESLLKQKYLGNEPDKKGEEQVKIVLEKIPAFSDLIEDIFQFENQDVFSRDRFGIVDFEAFNLDDSAAVNEYLNQLRSKLENAELYFVKRAKEFLLPESGMILVEEFDRNKSLFLKLIQHTARDIRPRFADANFHIYSHHDKEKVLHTKLAMKSTLINSLNEDWDLLLVVGERGGLLKSINPVLKENQRCSIIIAEETHLNYLNGRFKRNFIKKGGNMGLKLLPYWAHDYNMCLFLKRELDWKKAAKNDRGAPYANVLYKTGWDISRAVYYSFQYNNEHINPIYLEGKNLKKRYTGEDLSFTLVSNPDRLFLTRLFYGYYQKADLPNKNYEGYTHLTSGRDFDKQFEQWLIGLHEEF